MTIGEKIRYFRTRIGITQGKLAELSGIHPVSIRKYETNKMTPQPPQIEKIAESLGVSSFALTGIENNIRLETIGDFMGLLIMLCKTHIVNINGERGEDEALKPETVSFQINPFISNFFNAKADNQSVNADGISYFLKSNNMFNDILKWEKINYGYEKMLAKYGDTPEETIQKALTEMKENIESIEMELQRSNVVPDDEVGISVKNPHYYL